MFVVSAIINPGPFAMRLLALAAAPLLIIAMACSAHKQNDPRSINPAVGANVTENTKNPLADLNAAADAGKKLYLVNCASCHGDDGKGEGDFASSLPFKPSNLTADDVVSSTDGKIFLVIREGKMKDGKITMAPARGVTDEQIWQIVSYIRSLSKNKAGNKKED